MIYIVLLSLLLSRLILHERVFSQNSQFHGSLTILFTYLLDIQDSAGVQKRIPSVIVKILNQARSPTSAIDIKTNTTEVDTPTHASDNSSLAAHRYRRSEATGSYAQDGIILVRIEPAVRDGKLIVPLVAENTGMYFDVSCVIGFHILLACLHFEDSVHGVIRNCLATVRPN